MPPPAFGCAGCAAASRSAALSASRSPFVSPATPAPSPRRARPRLRAAALSAANEDDPSDFVAPPAAPPAVPWEQPPPPRAQPRRAAEPAPARKPAARVPRALVTSVALNLNGRDALPSVASLMRYMNDLRPKLDYLEPRARERVLSALEVANVAHEGQKRKSGEPFIIHPVAVAAILADMRMDRDCIIAGLLHDTVEDTPITLDELETLFGRDVRKIVEGETKFSKLAKKVHGEKASRTEYDANHVCVSDAPLSPSAAPDVASHITSHLSSLHSPSITPSTSSALGKTDKSSKDTVAPRIPSWQKEREKREEEQQKQADNLRAMFLAMTEDVRVIIVKLADRLHNMRTLAHMSPAKQKKISKETLEFFAPLAHRLGMRRIKSELEELSFMYLHPEEYQQLKYEVETMLRRSRFEYYLHSAEKVVKEVLEQDRILYNMIRSVEVIGSTKELYSIYRRMLVGENLASMLDIATMRVVVDLDPGVDSNQACYHVLGRIHTMWKPLPKRLKDYIAFPKPNGYQSLHTTVLLGQKFDFFAMEIQIRTAEMHRIAEEGIAAELFQSGSSSKAASLAQEDDGQEDSTLGPDGEWRRRTKGWLISIREYIEEFSSSRDLVDAVRRDLLGNRVFVFTPKGRIVDLPKDSTPVDVAYRIHSDVGHKMIGAKVNGRMVNLDYKLQNADVVKIIGSSSSTGPSSEWIGYAKSRTARQKIRQFLRARDRDNMLDRGRRILEEEARSLLEPIPSEAALTDIMPRLSAVVAAATGMKNVTTVDDLCIAIAKGHDEQSEFPLERTVLGLLRDRRHTVLSEAASVNHQSPEQKARAKRIWEGKAAKTRRLIADQVELVLPPCCHPVRGDEVLGIRMDGGENETIMVHRVRCEHMLKELNKRPASTSIVNLRWAMEHRKLDEGIPFPAPLEEFGVPKLHSDRSLGEKSAANSHDSKKPSQPARVVVIARDCDGLLSYVAGVLASMGTSIRRALTLTDPDTLVATLAFEVLVKDTYHLRRIIERIEACEEVDSARRLGPNESEEYFPLSLSRAQKPRRVAFGNLEESLLRLLQDGHLVAPSEMEIDDFDVNRDTRKA